MVAVADLIPLLAEAVAFALLTLLVILLARLVSVLSHQITIPIIDYSFAPLGWLADALSSYILAGAEDARKAVAGAMEQTWHGLVWSFNEVLGSLTDLAHLVRGMAIHLWANTVRPWVNGLLKPLRADVAAVRAGLDSLGGAVKANVAAGEDYATSFGQHLLDDATGFTRHEVAIARADAAAASAAITARLDGIGSQAEALAGSIAAAPDALWGDLKRELDPSNLVNAILLGVLGGLGIHALTDATGLDNSKCQNRHKDVCGIDPASWEQWVASLLLMGGVLDFAQLLALCRVVFSDGVNLVKSAE